MTFLKKQELLAKIIVQLERIAFSTNPEIKVNSQLTAIRLLMELLERPAENPRVQFEKPKHTIPTENYLTADEALALREKQIAENPEKYNFNEVKYGEERFMNETKNTRKNE